MDDSTGSREGGDPVDGVLAALAAWEAERRVDEAAESRVRERWLRQQAAESATLAGVLLDQAEAGAEVAVRTAAGHVLGGTVAAVGRDFAVVRSPAGRSTFVALAAVASVRSSPARRADASGDRSPPIGVSLADVLLRLSGDQPTVRIVAGAETVAGILRWVGADVALLEVGGEPPVLAHIPLAAVAEVSAAPVRDR